MVNWAAIRATAVSNYKELHAPAVFIWVYCATFKRPLFAFAWQTESRNSNKKWRILSDIRQHAWGDCWGFTQNNKRHQSINQSTVENLPLHTAIYSMGNRRHSERAYLRQGLAIPISCALNFWTLLTAHIKESRTSSRLIPELNCFFLQLSSIYLTRFIKNQSTSFCITLTVKKMDQLVLASC